MKNLKKVLALVMAFAMAFTMFAGAVAFDDVELGSDYSAAISMLSDLEVVSGNGKGSYEPAKAVTRAEMCVLIANMMNGGKADTARFAGGSNFSDVAHGWWGESAIAYCVQNGITYGVGGGKFAPNREITDAEAVAMLTRAMGYDTAANPLSFPYGNYTAAVNNGIVDNIPYAEGSACTKGEAAQMIYDCLFADYARLTANLNVIHGADDHDTCTLIEDVFGLSRAANAEPEKCTQHYWVIVGESCTDEDVIYVRSISDNGKKIGAVEEMECTADVSALIGYKVVLWGENEHGTLSKAWDVDVVKAVEVVDDQVAYDYNPAMADSKDNDKLAELDDLKVEDEKALNEKNGYSYVLIDWDNDGDVDYTKTTARFYGELETLTSKKAIVAVGTETYTLDLVDGETKEWDCACGEDEHDYVVELDAEEGDIVEITVEDTYEATLVISVAAVEPTAMTFTKMDSKGNKYFDGETLEDAGNHANDVIGAGDWIEDLVKADIDNEYDVYTNANGFVIYIDQITGSSDGYVLVMGVDDGVKKSISSRDKMASVEVMYTDGEVAELDVAFDADIPQYRDSDYTWDWDSTIVQAGGIIGAIVEYTLDDDGCVEEMEIVDTIMQSSYEFDAKYDEVEYAQNTVKFTGEDFVFVVDDDYVDADKLSNGDYVLEVDADKVAILTVDDLKDIDNEADYANNGAYYKDYGVLAGLSSEDQNASADYADGALFVVDDLAAYLGEKTHVVGAITDVTISSKGVYTFEMNDGEEYATGKTEDDETLYDAGIAFEKADSDIIEKVGIKTNAIKDYGYVLYADLTLLDGEVIGVSLLVKEGQNGMEPKYENKYSDYVVYREVIDRVLDDEIRTIYGRDVFAASEETLYTIDEYMDAAAKWAYVLNDDTVVYDVNEIPGLKTGIAIEDYIAYDKDFEITADGTLNESIWGKKVETDTYYVVDLIVEWDDEDGIVVAAYAFEEIEDEMPADTTSYVVEAWNNDGNVNAVAFNVTEVTEDFTGVVKASEIVNMIAELDVEVTVSVERVVADQSTMGDLGKTVVLELAYTNVRMANNGTDVVVELADALVDGDIVTVSVSGYGVADAFTFTVPQA